MTRTEKELWNTLETLEGKVYETVTINGKEYKVVTDKSFAFAVIRDMSTMKYLYDLHGVILYVIHKGIIPENLGNCIEEINKALIQLGWNVRCK